MRTCKILFVIVCGIFLSSIAFAQGGRTPGKLIVGATPLAQGDIKLGEELTTREGSAVGAGMYRISVNLNTLGEVQFILSPYKVDEPTRGGKGLEKNAFNTQRKIDPQVYVGGSVTKNLLVKGIASNLDGNFHIQNITPTEAVLTFNSKQFAANALLGRSLNSKLVDLVPTFVSLQEATDCGSDCIEGFVKVTVRNDGNSAASGKWNVVIVDPQFYVGTVEDVPPSGEKTVTSPSKIKLPCCNPAVLDAEVHADFYNSASADSNDSNNSKRFTVKLKQ
jgi:hypothetical protein